MRLIPDDIPIETGELRLTENYNIYGDYYHAADAIEINLQDLYDKYENYCDEVTASESMPWRSFGDYARDYISRIGEERK